MLKTKMVNGRSAPVLLCDECGEPLRQVGLSIAVHEWLEDEGQDVTCYHLHKGVCDKRFTGKWEKGERGQQESMEMSVYLAFLIHNSGFTPAGVAAALNDPINKL